VEIVSSTAKNPWEYIILFLIGPIQDKNKREKNGARLPQHFANVGQDLFAAHVPASAWLACA